MAGILEQKFQEKEERLLVYPHNSKSNTHRTLETLVQKYEWMFK